MADPKVDKIFAAAVRRAVHRKAENVEGKPKKIEHLADKLVEFALEGQGWAMQELANRLDGKAHQSQSVDANVGVTINRRTIYEAKPDGK